MNVKVNAGRQIETKRIELIRGKEEKKERR